MPGVEQKAQTPVSRNRYETSLANDLGLPTFYFALFPGKSIEIARTAGLDGVELWPTRPVQLKLRSGLLRNYQQWILTAHQSPRTERAKNLISSLRKAAYSTMMIGALPSLYDSVQDLINLRRIMGDIPVVLYKETPPTFNQYETLANEFEVKMIQIDPETIQKWKANNPYEYKRYAEILGFNYGCYDTNHVLRGHKSTGEKTFAADWERTISEFIENGWVKEIHVSARDDSIAAENGVKVARDLYNGTEDTKTIKILKKFAELGWKGNVVFETTGQVIAQVMGKKILTTKEMVDFYSKATNTLRDIFEEEKS